MMELEIRPGTAFGPLLIGMTEQEATDAMAAIGIAGERERDDADPVRIRFQRCLVAEFSLPDARLEFVELSHGPLRGVLDGVEVLAVGQAEAVDLLRRITGEEPRIDEDGDSVNFARSGAALWRGGDDERSPGHWEAVAVAPAGYFDPVVV